MNKQVNKQMIKEQFIKKLDPRMKLYVVLVYFVMVFVAEGILGAVISLAAAVGIWAASSISAEDMWKKIRLSYLIMLIIGILVAIGSTPLIALSFMLRIDSIIAVTHIYLESSEVYDQLDAMTKGLPIGYSIALNTIRVFRYLPSLGESMRALLAAAAYRGMRREEMTFIRKLKMYFMIQIPVFQRSFEKAKRFGEVMELRCYDSEANRKRMKPMKYGRLDILTALIVVLYAALIILLRVLL